MRLILSMAFILLVLNVFSKDYKVTSPNGQITVTVTIDTQIKWSAAVGNQSIFNNNTLSLDLGTTVLGVNAILDMDSIFFQKMVNTEI